MRDNFLSSMDKSIALYCLELNATLINENISLAK